MSYTPFATTTQFSDILEKPPQCSNTRNGIVGVRTFILTVTKGADYNSAVASLDALIVGGIPQRGDAYPGTYGIYADDCQCEAISPLQFQVTITYRVLSSVTGLPGNALTPLVSCGSSLQQQAIARDIAGALMTVGYKYANGVVKPDGTIGNGTTVDYSNATAQKQTPQFIYRVARRETAAPVAKAMAYVGYVNTDTFKTMAAGTVLCSRIEGNSNDEGLSWIVEYEFIYNPQGWLFGGWYVDINNVIPPDAANGGDIYTNGNGYKVFTIYPTLAFSGLSL